VTLPLVFVPEHRYSQLKIDFSAAYVHSVMDVQDNLYLRTDARVSRVIFEGNKAVGVAYVNSRNRSHGGNVKETIVCLHLTLTLALTHNNL
jgi:alcohol oxidase